METHAYTPLETHTLRCPRMRWCVIAFQGRRSEAERRPAWKKEHAHREREARIQGYDGEVSNVIKESCAKRIARMQVYNGKVLHVIKEVYEKRDSCTQGNSGK
eukprot:scaffold154352_cov22-Tisochrysis_lutea.AAC.2